MISNALTICANLWGHKKFLMEQGDDIELRYSPLKKLMYVADIYKELIIIMYNNENFSHFIITIKNFEFKMPLVRNWQYVTFQKELFRPNHEIKIIKKTSELSVNQSEYL